MFASTYITNCFISHIQPDNRSAKNKMANIRREVRQEDFAIYHWVDYLRRRHVHE